MNKYYLLNALGRLPISFQRWLWPPHFVLYGHLVSDRMDCMAAQRYRYPSFVEFDHFRNLAEKLGYRFVTLDQYIAGAWPRMILLTFDDGFVELVEFHRRTGLPFMLFFVAKALDEPAFGLGVFKSKSGAFLNRADIIVLKQAGVHVGFHTCSHKRIDTLADLTDEGVPPACHTDLMSNPLCFAYPFEGPADYSQTNAELFSLGYEFVFDTKFRVGIEGRHLFRIPMDRQRADKVENPIIANVLQARLASLKRAWRRIIRWN